MNQDIKIIFYITLFVLFIAGTLRHEQKIHPKQKKQTTSKLK